MPCQTTAFLNKTALPDSQTKGKPLPVMSRGFTARRNWRVRQDLGGCHPSSRSFAIACSKLSPVPCRRRSASKARKLCLSQIPLAAAALALRCGPLQIFSSLDMPTPWSSPPFPAPRSPPCRTEFRRTQRLRLPQVPLASSTTILRLRPATARESPEASLWESPPFGNAANALTTIPNRTLSNGILAPFVRHGRRSSPERQGGNGRTRGLCTVIV